MDIVGTVTAPARLGIRIAGWGIRTVGDLLPVGGGDEPAEARPEPREAPARPAPVRTTGAPEPRTAEPPVPEPPPPTHVDEGATVVAEFAESGAEEGAGAEVELAEPWDGYDRLHADELVDRLSAASSETLAAVALYERANRNRASVVEAAEEQLGRRSAPRPV